MDAARMHAFNNYCICIKLGNHWGNSGWCMLQLYSQLRFNCMAAVKTVSSHDDLILYKYICFLPNVLTQM